MFNTTQTSSLTITSDHLSGASPFVPMKSSHRRLVVGFFWLYLFGVTLLALINRTIGAELVIPALFLAIVVQLVPLIAYKPEYGWFHPLVFGAIFSAYSLLRMLPVYALGLESNIGLVGYDRSQLAWLVAASLFLSVIAQLAYYAGYFFTPRLRVPRLNFRYLSRVNVKAIIVVIISVALFAVYIQRQGGLVAHLLFLAQGRSYLINTGQLSGEWTFLARFSILACLIWLAVERSALRRPLFWIVVLLALIPQYLVMGSRSSIVQFIIVGLIVWMLRERRVKLIPIIVGVVISIILIGVLGGFRSSTIRGRVDWRILIDTSPIKSIERAVNEMRYRSSIEDPIYPILARVPNEVDLLYGRSYLTLLTTAVPRALWPGKPRTTGAAVGYVFLNMGVDSQIALSPIGEAFWNFHIPGVIFVFFLFGVFHKWCTTMFRKYAREPLMVLLYGMTLFFLNPSVLSIVTWIQILVSMIVLIILFGVTSSRTKAEFSK